MLPSHFTSEQDPAIFKPWVTRQVEAWYTHLLRMSMLRSLYNVLWSAIAPFVCHNTSADIRSTFTVKVVTRFYNYNVPYLVYKACVRNADDTGESLTRNTNHWCFLSCSVWPIPYTLPVSSIIKNTHSRQ